MERKFGGRTESERQGKEETDKAKERERERERETKTQRRVVGIWGRASKRTSVYVSVRV